jgi:hexosaminidase
MSELFQSDIFHMGGDEVNFRCWNETQSIIDWMIQQGYPDRTSESFLKFWSHFQVVNSFFFK